MYHSTSTDCRPLVLVDIDGVLNAFDAHRPAPHRRTAVAGYYRVVLDTRHPGWFDLLADYAELRWATMWQADAGPVFGRAAGLGAGWDYLDFDSVWATISDQRTGGDIGGYKWPLIEPLGDDDRVLVWIDDDMTDDQLAWAQARDHAGRPTLFVRPDPAEGFTVEDFARVLSFVRRHGVADSDLPHTVSVVASDSAAA